MIRIGLLHNLTIQSVRRMSSMINGFVYSIEVYEKYIPIELCGSLLELPWPTETESSTFHRQRPNQPFLNCLRANVMDPVWMLFQLIKSVVCSGTPFGLIMENLYLERFFRCAQ